MENITHFNPMVSRENPSGGTLGSAQTHKGLALENACLVHDFNNYLSVISAATQAALRDLDVDRDRTAMDLLKQALDACTAGSELCQQLLRTGAEPRSQVGKGTDLGRIVDWCLNLLRVRINRATVERSIPTVMPKVRISETKLRQVLFNVILNALASIDNESGKIEIHALPAFSDGKGEPMITVTITDNGIGMDDRTLANIFSPYYSANKPSGTGLGLASVWSIIEEERGRISCRSAVGKGTSFVISLPLANQ